MQWRSANRNSATYRFRSFRLAKSWWSLSSSFEREKRRFLFHRKRRRWELNQGLFCCGDEQSFWMGSWTFPSTREARMLSHELTAAEASEAELTSDQSTLFRKLFRLGRSAWMKSKEFQSPLRFEEECTTNTVLFPGRWSTRLTDSRLPDTLAGTGWSVSNIDSHISALKAHCNIAVSTLRFTPHWTLVCSLERASACSGVSVCVCLCGSGGMRCSLPRRSLFALTLAWCAKQ